MQNNLIYIAADHAGFKLKQEIISFLEQLNISSSDLGCFDEEAVDYPDYAHRLCEEMKSDVNTKGILVCGSGIGMSIAANRHKHIRAALCTDAVMAKLSREHNDSNVLVLGARIIEKETAFACIKEFLNTEFKGQKHQIRIDKL
jgi:ribose 5-phosphate isomerase B